MGKHYYYFLKKMNQIISGPKLHFYKEGTLKLIILKADLARDTTKFAGQMDPFVTFDYNDLEYKTRTS
jgi:hypothetical protein